MAKTKAKTKTTREVGDSAPKGLTIRSTNPAIMSEQILQLSKMIKSSDEASEISYDNTTSGLTAENVQAAIDEVSTGLSTLEASDVGYDNTDSGLEATNAQAAIDEVNTKVGGVLGWTLIGTIDSTSEALDVSGYTELYIVPQMQGSSPAFPMIMINAPGTACANSGREGSGYALDYKISISADSGATVLNTLSGWTSVTYKIYGR